MDGNAKHVSPSASSDDDGFSDHFFDDDRGVLGNRLRLAPAGDLVDELFADLAPHLADAAGGNRDHDAADLPDEILRPALGGRLLAVEEPREEIDRRGQDDAAERADAGRRQRAEAVVGGDGAKRRRTP